MSMLEEMSQLQVVRSWWKKYDKYLVTLLVVLALLIGGSRYWWTNRANALAQVSMSYTQMLSAYEKKRVDEYVVLAERILSDHPKTIYASFSALILAKSAVEKGDLKLAEQRLNFVVNTAPISAVRQIARLRMARLLIAGHKYEAALTLLKTVDDNRYLVAISEIKGDAWLGMKNVVSARAAYRQAAQLQKETPTGMQSPLLKAKLQLL